MTNQFLSHIIEHYFLKFWVKLIEIKVFNYVNYTDNFIDLKLHLEFNPNQFFIEIVIS